MTNRPVVSVFGSSQIGEDHPEYVLAYDVGKGLAEAGFAVCTGGYDGAMAAVSRGAKDGGSTTIGVTLDTFQRLTANPWVDEEIKTETLLLRLENLVTHSVGYIILPGGIGTLLELALVWNLALTGVLGHKPIVVVGEGWRQAIERMREVTHVREIDLGWLLFADDAEGAVAVVQATLAAGPRDYGAEPKG